jgi:hypothetical protein
MMNANKLPQKGPKNAKVLTTDYAHYANAKERIIRRKNIRAHFLPAIFLPIFHFSEQGIPVWHKMLAEKWQVKNNNLDF